MKDPKSIPAAGSRSASSRTWGEWALWVVAEDHCEWANQYVAWLKTPLGVLLIGAVCSLLCGLFVAPQGYAMLAAIAAIVLIGSAWPWIAMRAISCNVDFTARRGREGESAGAKIIVTNRWPWPVWGITISDPLIAGGGSSEAAVALARVDGWSRATFDCAFTPPLRGVYPRGEVRIGTGFPFGLYQASRPVAVEQKLLVWPRTFPVPPLVDRPTRRDWRGQLSAAQVGMEGARLGAREHRHGDSLRDVHWAKSARYDRLIVAEREAAAIDDVVVLVDIDPARHTGDGADSTLEWSLRIAASVCESVIRQRGGVTVWLGADELPRAAGSTDLIRLLDQLATVNLADPESRGSEALAPYRGGESPAVSIGTDASPPRSRRRIVLRAEGFGDEPSDPVQAGAAWITVDSPNDVPGQVQRGWRGGRPRVICGA